MQQAMTCSAGLSSGLDEMDIPGLLTGAERCLRPVQTTASVNQGKVRKSGRREVEAVIVHEAVGPAEPKTKSRRV